MKARYVWDAIVIGSGANGSVAAMELAERGHSVLVLEAGPERPGFGDYGRPAFNLAKQLQRHYLTHRQESQKRHPTYWTTNPNFFIDDVQNPYTTPDDAPFCWIRGRQVGGRTLAWDGVTPRFSEHEFKAARLDAFGPEWPIGHADLAPHYSDIERLLGVHGSTEGLDTLPDGAFLAPRPLSPGELVFKQRVEGKHPERRVLPSRGIRASRRPDKGERHTRLSAQATTLARALDTGRTQIRANSMALRILYGADGKHASGVELIDTVTREKHAVLARSVFVCGSTIESVRLLLSSGDSQHPGGLGASSGALGHYLMDHQATNTYFYMPDVPDHGKSYELLGSDSLLIPRYQNLGAQTQNHLRGYGFWGGIQRMAFPHLMRRHKGMALGFLCARSEALPHYENRVTLDPEVKDAWGHPVPHIDCRWRGEDLKIGDAAQQDCLEMIELAGGRVEDLVDLVHMPVVGRIVRQMQSDWLRSTPGLFVHEVGGARMGSRPDDSVVNPFCQVWEAPNVFVTDGACWPTSGWQNPTLTEMAITARAALHASRILATSARFEADAQPGT
jgi:choline dehydrogenase-like flavoprotein